MSTPTSLPADHPARSKDNKWYLSDIGSQLTPEARELLEQYSNIPPDQVEAHILQCRDQAWSVFPFPCLGNLWFLRLALSRHRAYAELLARFRTAPATRLLDVGTCVGQDLRKLAFDGAPAASLCGTDLHAEFEAAGKALFCDAGSWAGGFVAANVLDDRSALTATAGEWDVVHASMFLHVFDEPDCKNAARQLLRLLRPVPDSWILGVQTGDANAGPMRLGEPWVGPGDDRTVYRHSPESFKEMWNALAQEESVELDVWTNFQPLPAYKGRRFFSSETTGMLWFWVKRL